jgi:uncharacterized protein YbjT (DUF2867 family)
MILVAGSTGVLGSEIVRRLRAQGAAVRCLVRSSSAEEKVRQLESLGVQIIRGDLKDKSSLERACEGVDTVISTVSAITTAAAGDSFGATDKDGTIALIDAAKARGVERFVFVSFDTSSIPDCPLRDAKLAVEAHLRKSGMTYTILQPTLFMEAWLGPMLFADVAAGTAKIYGDGDRKLPYVSVSDVASVAVQSLSSPRAKNAVIPFTGVSASQNEVRVIFEEAFGKPFSAVEIPEAVLEAQWQGAEDPFQKTFCALMLGVAGKGFGGSIGALPSDIQLQSTTIREFATRQAAS